MLSRQQVVEPVVLNINQTVGNLDKMLRRLIKENIQFSFVLDPQLDRVKADPGQIEQIVLNLVVNARDAMPNGGSLRIQTKNVEKSNPQSGPEAAPSRFVLLEVTDTGTGMDQQTQAHIFEPFFTTKAVGKGTGTGPGHGLRNRETELRTHRSPEHTGAGIVVPGLSSRRSAGGHRPRARQRRR